MNKHGFTLVEVIISALILALSVGGVLFIFSTEKGVVARTGRRIQAMDFARQTLEELKDEVGADTWPTGGRLGIVGVATPDLLPAGDFKDVFNGSRSYTVTDMDPNLSGGDPDYKSATVTVSWTEPAEPAEE